MHPSVFFGTSDFHAMRADEVRAARAICAACPVQRECLVYSLATEQRWGVWGGLTAGERHRAVTFLETNKRILASFDAGKLKGLVQRRGR